MALSGVSLNGATAVGAGSEIFFDTPKSNIGLQITMAGWPAGVSLQGTNDGVNWGDLVAYTGAAVNATVFVVSNGTPVIGVRAYLNSWSGGAIFAAVAVAE